MENETFVKFIPPPIIHNYQIVLGCLTFFLVLPFVLVPFNRYPLGSTGAVLVGAFLMVVTTVINQEEVYRIIGDVNNLKTIFLLWGMMIISSFFERERIVDRLLTKLFPLELSFYWWIVRLSIVDSILAALFTNDVACVILTPLVLRKWIEQKRDKSELNTLLLTIATQANIGSTLTIFGNPQMALMASKSNDFVDYHSRLELKTCVKYLWLPTLIVWLLNIIFLTIHYRLNRSETRRKVSEKISNRIAIIERRLFKQENLRIRPRGETDGQISMIPMTANRSLSVVSFASSDQQVTEDELYFQPSQSLLFKSILSITLITVIILLFFASEKIHVDIGLIPVSAAIVLLCADTFINHRSPTFTITRIDWNVLLLFFGLFVWLHGLNSTGIPHRIWLALKLDKALLTDVKSLFLFFLFTIIGSNIFSNVPLTLLVLEQVPRTGDHLNLILYLAFLTTIAGNLTLFGSVANLIVAQKALASSLEHRFDFWTYLKFGFPTTILFCLVGMFVIYGLLQISH